MLRIRPPLLHIFAAARAPPLHKRGSNRRFALHCEFRWHRLPLSTHGSSSYRESLPQSYAPLRIPTQSSGRLGPFYDSDLHYIHVLPRLAPQPMVAVDPKVWDNGHERRTPLPVRFPITIE